MVTKKRAKPSQHAPEPKITRKQFFDEIDFASICELWSRADFWPLRDAVHLILGLKPPFFGNGNLDALMEFRRDVTYQLALNSLGEYLSAEADVGDTKEYRVRPHEFLTWATLRFPNIPTKLTGAVDEATKKFKRDQSKGLRPSQRHRERCQAVAALLWRRYATDTKEEMARRPELLEIGCEGHEYGVETLMEWIKGVNPNRQPGRRRKE